MREQIKSLREEVYKSNLKKDTEKKKTHWKFPFKWQSTIKKSIKSDKVLVWYLSVKGEIEKPRLLPIYSGNIVVIKDKPYEIDPRAFWTLRIGSKMTKALIYKEIDRRPVSNLDWDEIKKRGDATDSDEFLIKMALRAVQKEQFKQMGKTALIIFLLALAGLLIYFFTR